MGIGVFPGVMGLAVLMCLSARPALAADPLGATLAELAERFRFPGALLLVSGPDGSETAAFGTANLSTRIPVDADTRFHAASVGKMVTAVAVLQLVGEGKLSLDAPVRPFLTEDEARRLTHVDQATVGQLLSHVSGIPDCLRNAAFSVPEHPHIAWSAAEALRLGRCRPATVPGRFAYSNTNYILLGYILEKLDGGDLAASLARRVLDPLEMSGSTAAVDPADRRLAQGYRLPAEDGTRKSGSHLAWSSRLGDAPLTTTARDLEQLFNSLFRPGFPRLLSETILAGMMREHGSDDGDGYGWGVQRIATDVGPRYGHSGRFGGYAAEAWYYPDLDRIIILLANGDEHTADDPMDIIEARLLGAQG